MNALITGSTGLLGSSLVRALRWEGHSVRTDACAEWVDELAEIDVVFHASSQCLSVSHLRLGTVATFATGPMLGPGDISGSAVGRWVLEYLRAGSAQPAPGGACIVDARDVAAAMITAAEKGASGDFTVAGPNVEYAEVLAMLQGITRYAGRLHGRVELAPTRPVSSPRAAAELNATYRPIDETLRDIVAWFIECDRADLVA